MTRVARAQQTTPAATLGRVEALAAQLDTLHQRQWQAQTALQDVRPRPDTAQAPDVEDIARGQTRCLPPGGSHGASTP
jgi:hypothetical protein